MATKEDLIRVFEDTERLCRENERLKSSIAASVEGDEALSRGEDARGPRAEI